MFSWIGFFGKLVEYIAKKVADKTIDPTFNSRKLACKAFITLYDAIVSIEFLTDDFIRNADEARQGKPKVFKQWIQNHAKKLDLASSNFLETISSLSTAIAIYDPNLSNLFSQVVISKKKYLQIASFPSLGKSIILEINENGLLTYTEPDDETMRVDLDLYYTRISKMHERDIAAEWPDGVVAAILRDHVTRRVVNTADRDHIESVIKMTQLHLDLLRQARKSLQSFIREEFSIEDLLFVTR